MRFGILVAWFFASPAWAEVGIFKGTFDPVHVGHRNTLLSAQKAGDLKVVYVYPNMNPSHKDGASPLTQRWEMLDRGVKDLPGVKIVPLSVLRRAYRNKDPIESVRHWVQNQHRNEPLFSILGADSYLALPSLDRVLDAKTPSQILVVERTGTILPDPLPRGVHRVPEPKQTTSSTQIRSNVFHNQRLLPSSVASYIFDHGLYDTVAHPAVPPKFWDLLFQEQARMVTDGGDPARLAQDNNEQAKKYRPEARGVFPLPTYWMDATRLEGFEAEQIPASIRRAFVRKRNGKTQYRLVVHPESKKFYGDLLRDAQQGEPFLGTPTASPRSLVVWEEGQEQNPFLVKVSLDREVGETVRTIGRSEILRSLGTNAVLTANKDRLPNDFLFFPEVLGLIPTEMERGGMVVRALPPEFGRNGRRLVPLFSLYASTPEGAPPVLATMIRQSGLAPDVFIQKHISGPFLRQYLDLGIDHGISMEAHGQNVLIEIGRDGLPTGRFVFRDLGGFNLDLGFMKARGHTIPPLPFSKSIEATYHQKHAHHYSSTGLQYYFSGGFLYDLDQRLPEWIERGWIPRGRVGRGQIENQFIRDVEQVLWEKAQVKANLGQDLESVHLRVHAARRRLHGLLRHHCETALGELGK